MSERKPLNRRAFFTRIGGAVLAGGALTAITSGSASATDRDPSDPAGGPVTDRDPVDAPGRGRGTVGRPGVTDQDSGAQNDPAGRGRGTPTGGARRPAAVTDRDPVDAPGRGRGTVGRAGVNDQDSGATADPANRGRGAPTGGRR